jgi:hypothetical protein
VKEVTQPKVHLRQWLGQENSYPGYFCFGYSGACSLITYYWVIIPRDNGHVSDSQEATLQ